MMEEREITVTKEMADAGIRQLKEFGFGDDLQSVVKQIYQEMVRKKFSIRPIACCHVEGGVYHHPSEICRETPIVFYSDGHVSDRIAESHGVARQRLSLDEVAEIERKVG